MSQKAYQTVILAGLLHDIGKALQRGSGGKNITGKHPEVSRTYINAFSQEFSSICDLQLLGELVQRHHESSEFPSELRVQDAPESVRPLAYLISQADNLSSAERGENSAKYKDYKTQPLASVFSRMEIGKPLPEPKYYSLSALDANNAFPDKFSSLNSNLVNKHLNEMGEQLAQVVRKCSSLGFKVFFTQLLSCLEKYTWCLPSNTQEEQPDVSLYDHLRTTSAIAAALYKYHTDLEDFSEKSIRDMKTEKFRLAVGDLSGIQSFIFDVSHTGAGGIAKRLRARSFYLSLLSDVISHKILDLFDLPISNIIMSSGGKFYVLLPNTKTAEETINNLQKELDEYSLKVLGGEVIVNLAQLSFNAGRFRDFGTLLGELAEKLSFRKNRPLLNSLSNEQQTWDEEKFIRNFIDYEQLGLCDACGKAFGDVIVGTEKTVLCRRCEHDLEMGSRLTRTKYLAFFNKSIPGGFKVIDNFYVYLSEDVHFPDEPYLVTSFAGNPEALLKYPVLNKFYANHVPTAREAFSYESSNGNQTVKKGDILSFDYLVENARGKKLLACLKADVDNLGSLFVFGLKRKERDFGTISRLSTLSRMLDLFFSGWVNKKISNDYPSCYVVFSGGDDLMLIGPWNDIIKLSRELNEEFQRFTGHNSNLTLSAGIYLAKVKTPISTIGENSEALLELAKETVLPDYSEGRQTVLKRKLMLTISHRTL